MDNTFFPFGTELKTNYQLYDVAKFDSIREMLDMAASEAGDRTAYKFKEKGEVREVTYSEFHATVNALGTGLSLMGCGGVHTAMIGENSYNWILSYLTILCGDGVFVPVDKDLLIDEILHILTRSDCEAVFVSRAYADKLRSRFDEVPAVKKVICFGCEGMTEDDRFVTAETVIKLGADALAAGDRSYLDAKSDLRALKMLVFTSGTTGIAKGVMLSEHNLVSSVYYGMQISSVHTTSLSVLPYNHTYESVCDLLVAIHHHSTLCINENLRAVAENMKLYKPDYMMLVPLFAENLYKKIWNTAETTGKAGGLRTLIKVSQAMRKVGIDKRKTLFKSILDVFGGNMIKIVCGGAPIRPEIAAFFDAIGIILINGYGITECSPLVSVNRDFFNDYRTVGVPLSCINVKIHEPNAAGEGEVLVRGDVVMLGYYKDPEATAEAIQNGWFYTGDYGKTDDGGRILITGRKKNLIVLKNGKNIYPEEIERYMGNIPQISEVVVYSVKNESGEEVALCAEMFLDEELVGTLDAKERLELMKKEVGNINRKLPSHKRVVKIKIRQTEFEKTTSRKIRRVNIGVNDDEIAEDASL